jgi:hypothetical protein
MPPPTSLAELYERTKESAIKLSGASVCHVEAVVPVVTGDEEGIYFAELRIVGLNPLLVVPWLERLLKGEIRTPGEVHSALNAVVAMYHEHIHALGPRQLGAAYGRSIYLEDGGAKGAVEFEDGVSELWARTSLTRFANATGIDELLNQPINYESNIYLLEMGAVASIVEKIAEMTSTNELDVLQLMASHTPDTRVGALAEYVADHRGVSGTQRLAVVDEFRQAFRDIQLVDDLTSDAYPGRSRTDLWAAITRAEGS